MEIDKLAENYALYRDFMGFVKENYPEVYKEYWLDRIKEEELIPKLFSKERRKE